MRLNFTDQEWGTDFKTIFGLSTTVYRYTFGTIHGIYTPTADGIDIITIDNAVPHNGHFVLF